LQREASGSEGRFEPEASFHTRAEERRNNGFSIVFNSRNKKASQRHGCS